MLTAIEFNDQMRISAKKIDDVTGDRYLAFEFQSLKSAIANVVPQCTFCIRGIAAQASGDTGRAV
jgi:hypothetical protein